MTRFNRGDKVACTVGHYKSYHFNEEASVLDVDGGLIKLANDLTDYGFSWYIAKNFRLVEPVREVRQKEARTVGYAKTKYFAVKLDTNAEGENFLNLKISTGDIGEPFNEQTVLRNSKSEALRDVQSNIKEGEKWVVLQTVALIEPEAPMIPIKVTDLR